MDMLSPEIIKKIKKTHIKSSRLVNTLMAGQYKSVFRGSGIEFEEVREYTPGDEVKSIDWKVSARLGKPFVKRYREERELIIMLLVDMSASILFGTRGLKMETAAETASILAFNAIRNNDKVGAILFTDRVEKHIPPKKGSAHVWRVIKEIYGFAPHGVGTDMETAVRFMGRVCRRRSTAFLISDFLRPSLEAGALYDPRSSLCRQLAIAGKKHELISVLLTDPGERVLPPGGMLLARDLESGKSITVDAADKSVRTAFGRAKKQENRRIRNRLKAADIDCIPISTDQDAADVLSRYFRYREKRKR